MKAITLVSGLALALLSEFASAQVLDQAQLDQIHSTYGSSSRVYSVNDVCPAFGGPSGFVYAEPGRDDYIKSRAFMAIPGAAIAVCVFLGGIIYAIVRACQKPRGVVAGKETYEDAYGQPVAVNGSHHHGHHNGVATTHNSETYHRGGGRFGFGSRPSNAFWSLLALTLTACCAALAAASLWFNQEAHNNINTIQYQSTNVFNDINNFTNQITAAYPVIANTANNVLNQINSYRYIGNDVSTYTHDAELGRFPATIVIMALIMLSFVMLLLGTPVMCLKRAWKRGNCSRAWLMATAVIMWAATVLNWLLFALYLPLLKANADLCVYADQQEGMLNQTFGGQQVGEVASDCLLGSNVLPAYGFNNGGSLSCAFVGNDYESAKGAMCQNHGLIDDTSFLTLFTFIMGVLLIPALFMTCMLSRRATNSAKAIVYDDQPMQGVVIPPTTPTTTQAAYEPTEIRRESEYAPYEQAPVAHTNYSSSSPAPYNNAVAYRY